MSSCRVVFEQVRALRGRVLSVQKDPIRVEECPSHFQRAIDTILGSYRYEFALAFIDDVVVYSKSLDEHLLHVSLVLEELGNAGMTVSERKCHFAYRGFGSVRTV